MRIIYFFAIRPKQNFFVHEQSSGHHTIHMQAATWEKTLLLPSELNEAFLSGAHIKAFVSGAHIKALVSGVH